MKTISNTGAAEIQAAIATLTKLRDATPGGWEIEPTGELFDPRFDSVRIMHEPLYRASENYDRYIIIDGSYAADSGGFNPHVASLIVTLHRTIDAQLAILASALGDAEGSHDEPGAFDAALVLARAINGTE